MTGVALAFVILLLIACLVAGYRDIVTQRQERKAAQLRRSLRSAGSTVDQDYARARQDMNDAAGQSWRNLADGHRG